MAALQASCSELVLLVDRERAEEVLWRALEYGRRYGELIASFRTGDPERPAETRRLPGDAELVFRVDEGRGRITVGNYEMDEPWDEVSVVPRTLGDRFCGPWIRLVYYDWEGGAQALLYGQHSQPNLYPILARLSYEFRAPVMPESGGNLWYFERWLKEHGIDYIEWSDPNYDRPGILVTGPVPDELLAEAAEPVVCQ